MKKHWTDCITSLYTSDIDDPNHFKEVENLNKLTEISIDYCDVSYLNNVMQFFPELEVLCLTACANIRPELVEGMCKEKISSITLTNIDVTVEMCKQFAKMPKLGQLNLTSSHITDACLHELTFNTKLHSLRIFDVIGLSSPAIRMFRAKNPQCTVRTNERAD